ncbi:MAG: hypothetical protein U0230_24310 [Polyangiales bacterium]
MRRGGSLALAFAAALVGCAEALPPPPRVPEARVEAEAPSPPAFPLERLADPAALGIGVVELGALRASPYGEAADEALARVLAPDEAIDVLDVVERTERALLSIRTATSDSYVGVAILRGRFAPGDAARLAGASGASVVPFLPDSVVARGERSDAALVADHTLIVGERALVDAALERQAAGGDGAEPSDPRFASLAAALGWASAGVRFAILPDPSLLRSLEREAFRLPSGALDGVRGYGLAAEVGEPVRLRAVLFADTATRLVVNGLLEAELARASEDDRVRARGLDALAGRARPGLEGEMLRLDLELGADEAIRLLGGRTMPRPVDP